MADDITEVRGDRDPRRRAAVLVLVVVVLGVYAWWAVARPPFSSSATLAVVGAGALAVVLGVARRRDPMPPVPPETVVRWGLLAVALAGWQLLAFVQEPREDHPTLSSLTNAALDTQPVRAGALVLWIVAAWELARR